MKIKQIILTLIIACLFANIASATTYSNNFNDGTIGSGWTSDGSWVVQSDSPSIDGTYYVVGTAAYNNKELYRSFTDATYWEWDFMYDESVHVASTSAEGFVYTKFAMNTTTYAALVAEHTGSGTFRFRFYDNGSINPEFVTKTNLDFHKIYHVEITYLDDTDDYQIIIYEDDVLMSTDIISRVNDFTTITKFDLFIVGRPDTFTIIRYDNFYMETEPPGASGVSWTKSDYYIGDTVSFNWNINETEWNKRDCLFGFSVCNYWAYIMKDGVPFPINGNLLDSNVYVLSTMSGTIDIPVGDFNVWDGTGDGTGTYVVQMTKGIILATSGDYQDSSSAYMRLSADKYLEGQRVVVMGQTLPYIWSHDRNVVDSYLTLQKYDYWGFPESYTKYISTGSGVNGVTNVTFSEVGKFRLALWNFDTFKVDAEIDVEVLESGTDLGVDILYSKLEIDNNVYNKKSSVYYLYQVDSINWTNNSYIYVSLVSSGNIMGSYQKVTSQVGSGSLDLEESDYGVIQTGASFVNLTAKTNVLNTTPKVLVSIPVTVISAGTDGYSIVVSTQNICRDEKFKIIYNSTAAGGHIKELYVNKVGQSVNKTYSVFNSGSISRIMTDIEIRDKSAINYEIYDNSGTIKDRAIAYYRNTDCTISGEPDVTPTVTPVVGTTTSDEMTSDILGLLSNTVFWSVVVMLATAVIIGTITGGAPVPVALGIFVTMIASTLIGWFPLWGLFAIILLMILLLAAMMATKISNVGGSGGGN